MPMQPNPTGRPVRIAHVIQNLNYGGMERVLHSLTRRLPPRGFEVHIVVLEYLGRFAEGLEGAVTFHKVPPMSRFSLLHPGQLIATLRRIAPDVVHSHTGVWLKASRAARVARVPVMVHTEHGRPDPVPLSDRLIDNQASRWTDAVIAVSEALAGVLRRQVVHDPAQIRVIINGVEVEDFRPPDDRDLLRRALGLALGVPVIGSIGRLEPVKNYSLALQAFARLGVPEGGEAPPLLVLAGDGSQRADLEALAAELGIAPRVRFLGWRPDADRLYGAFDVFTLSSRSEGTSISLLEAMSTGVCPVVTDVGGNRAVLGPGLDSLVVPGDDAAALAGAWQRQLADPGLRATMGARARLRVQSAFSLERMVDQHVELYRELLEHAGGSPKARSAMRPGGRR
jgi:glycosyltransferase involved in cell wall biosynthesis